MPLPTSRHLFVVITVVTMHIGLLWLLQAGFPRRSPPEIVVPAAVLAEWIPPPAPGPTAAPPAPPAPAARPTSPPTPRPAPAAPMPVPPVASPTPSAEPLPSTDVAEAAPPAAAVSAASTSSPIAAPAPVDTAGAGSASAAPAPARVEWPSAAASYLNNPPPRYPPVSRRLGEQGKVVLRVRIEVDGSASQAEVRTSSGYARLDQTALQTALAWRYVPGTRNGVPEAMWFNVPIQFVLE